MYGPAFLSSGAADDQLDKIEQESLVACQLIPGHGSYQRSNRENQRSYRESRAPAPCRDWRDVA